MIHVQQLVSKIVDDYLLKYSRIKLFYLSFVKFEIQLPAIFHYQAANMNNSDNAQMKHRKQIQNAQ